MGTTIFWTLLILWSGLIAYFLSVRGIGPATLFAYITGERISPTTAAPRRDRNDIVYAEDAFSSESLPADLPSEQVSMSTDIESSDQRMTHEDRIRNAAEEIGVLISDEGARHLLQTSGGEYAVALNLLMEVVHKAREVYPREDGWLHLNRERILGLFPEKNNLAVHSTAESLRSESADISIQNQFSNISNDDGVHAVRRAITFLFEGREEDMLMLLRSERKNGRSVRELARGMLSILDEAYRTRVDGRGGGDTFILEQINRYSDRDIETLITVLSGGVDYSYRDMDTGIKVSCIRALDYLRTKRA
jgi:hypothetical protein